MKKFLELPVREERMSEFRADLSVVGESKIVNVVGISEGIVLFIVEIEESVEVAVRDIGFKNFLKTEEARRMFEAKEVV